MSLVNCFECEKEVSETAKVCPHCGVKKPAISPEDEKIEQKKANKGCFTTIAVVFTIALVASFFEEEKTSFAPETNLAQNYIVIKEYSYPTPPDKQGLEVTIYSKDATTLEKRSQTAIKAALDILEDKSLYEVTIKMNAHSDNSKFNSIAHVQYNPYEKNTWGEDVKFVWQVQASPHQITGGKIIENGKSYPLDFLSLQKVLEK